LDYHCRSDSDCRGYCMAALSLCSGKERICFHARIHSGSSGLFLIAESHGTAFNHGKPQKHISDIALYSTALDYYVCNRCEFCGTFSGRDSDSGSFAEKSFGNSLYCFCRRSCDRNSDCIRLHCHNVLCHSNGMALAGAENTDIGIRISIAHDSYGFGNTAVPRTGISHYSSSQRTAISLLVVSKDGSYRKYRMCQNRF